MTEATDGDIRSYPLDRSADFFHPVTGASAVCFVMSQRQHYCFRTANFIQARPPSTASDNASINAKLCRFVPYIGDSCDG